MEKIPKIDVGGARIPKFEPPVVERLPQSVVDRPDLPQLVIPKPVVDVPRPTLEYPTIFVPPSIGSPTPQRPAEPSKEKPDANRNLPPSPPPIPSVPPPPPPVPVIPIEQPTTGTVISVVGHDIKIPGVQEVAQASVTAIVGTSVTLATALVFNQARRVVGEAASKAVREKFKIKLRSVKPVIHMICESGEITVLEYSSEGVRTLATRITNPEQFLRDTVESDELYEADHKIVIDEPIRDMFSREGAKRFNYFAPSKKMARRLSARIALG
jgi:hypothetical protein